MRAAPAVEQSLHPEHAVENLAVSCHDIAPCIRFQTNFCTHGSPRLFAYSHLPFHPLDHARVEFHSSFMTLSQRHSHVPTIDYPSSIRSKGILRKGTVTFSTPSKTVAAADCVRRSVSEHKPPACSVAPLLQKSAVLASVLTAVQHGDTETPDTTSDLYKFSSFSSAKHPQASWTAPRSRTGTQVMRPLAIPG